MKRRELRNALIGTAFALVQLACTAWVLAEPIAGARAHDGRVLLIDDDNGWDNERAFLEELPSMGRPLTVWNVSQQGEPDAAAVAGAQLVVWVTGGRWGDLRSENVRLLEDRIRHGGSTLIAGKYTGRELSWGFVDRWSFGFEYRNTTFMPENVVSARGFSNPVQVATDFGAVSGGEPLYVVQPRQGGDPGAAGAAAAVRHWAWGARVAWLGFDLRDVWSSWDRRQILRDVLWHVGFTAAGAVAELARKSCTGERRAFLLKELEGDLLREGREGGPAAEALSAVEKLPADVAAMQSSTQRLMHGW